MAQLVTNEQTSADLHSRRDSLELTNSRKTYYDITHQMAGGVGA